MVVFDKLCRMAWSSVVFRTESVSGMVGSSKLHRVGTGREKGKQYHIPSWEQEHSWVDHRPLIGLVRAYHHHHHHHHHPRISSRRKSWNKTSGPLCVMYYTTAVMSTLLWPIVCIAVWSVAHHQSAGAGTAKLVICCWCLMSLLTVLQARADDDRGRLVCTLTKSSVWRHRHKFVFFLFHFLIMHFIKLFTSRLMSV